MRYILYSPPGEVVREAFTRANGEEVPEKVFPRDARALYQHKRLADRRYRQPYPAIDTDLRLVKCKTFEEAKQEQEALKNYCGEVFEIHEYEKGQIGPQVVEFKIQTASTHSLEGADR